VEDAMAAYLTEVADVRALLDGRYDDIKSGRVKPVDGDFLRNPPPSRGRLTHAA
jgi:hypothetical protein